MNAATLEVMLREREILWSRGETKVFPPCRVFHGENVLPFFFKHGHLHLNLFIRGLGWFTESYRSSGSSPSLTSPLTQLLCEMLRHSIRFTGWAGCYQVETLEIKCKCPPNLYYPYSTFEEWEYG